MSKVVKIKISAKPISSKNYRVKTSVSDGGTTRTKTQTIRVR